MPELPDILAYVDALHERVGGHKIERAMVRSPALMRTAEPPLRDVVGRRVTDIRRIGKRLVLALEDELFIVIHLMIAGRLHWKRPGLLPTGRIDSAVLGFDAGTLLLTEASTKKRAELHVVRGAAALERFDRGGLDISKADLSAFRERLKSENHTVKRTLTDPRLFDGIGNAYSDEILHAAKMSPLVWTSRMTADEVERLYEAARNTLQLWIEKLSLERANGFPEKVTAFRKDMAVHGKFKEPCPVCGTLVQRIRYADNETNYCPRCQTDGKLLADRSLSQLLKADWPRTIEDLEELQEKQREARALATPPSKTSSRPRRARPSRRA